MSTSSGSSRLKGPFGWPLVFRLSCAQDPYCIYQASAVGVAVGGGAAEDVVGVGVGFGAGEVDVGLDDAGVAGARGAGVREGVADGVADRAGEGEVVGVAVADVAGSGVGDSSGSGSQSGVTTRPSSSSVASCAA